MQFTELNLSPETLSRLGLPDIPYEVPTVYFEYVGIDPENPSLAAMLFSLQKRAANGMANWLKIAPAMDALVLALFQQSSDYMLATDQPGFTIQFAKIDLNDDVIAIQRQDRIVGALAQAGGGRVKCELFHPPCARTIETLIGLSHNADTDGQFPCYGTPWDCALDTAAGNGQVYAAMEGVTYIAPWRHGIGFGPDKRPVEEWLKAREEASSWPIEQGFGAIAINAYTAMTDFLKKLPTEESQEEVLPAFYALSNPTPEPDPIIPLNAYNLSQPEGRFAFLWALYNDYQEDGLLMAVNHVWDCLDTPRSLRCALMAQKVGKSGTGKQALMRFLKRFLGETLYEFEVPDLPNREAYLHFDEWNDACLEHFDRLNKRMSRIVARYETILDGREPQDDQLVPKHALIKGPWTVAD